MNIKIKTNETVEQILINEFNSFQQQLLNMSPIEILNTSYEYTFKKELKDILLVKIERNKNFIEYLLELYSDGNTILQYFYDEWINSDYNLSDIIEELIGEIEDYNSPVIEL